MADYTLGQGGGAISGPLTDLGDGSYSAAVPLAGFQQRGSTPVALQPDGGGSQYAPTTAIYVSGTGGGSCGLGAELALLVPVLQWLRRRRAGPGRPSA